MKTLEDLIKELPLELQQEVRDFAQFLLETKVHPKQQRRIGQPQFSQQFLLEMKVRPKQKKLRMTWAGALREFRDQFTSLELQKKALEWWGD